MARTARGEARTRAQNALLDLAVPAGLMLVALPSAWNWGGGWGPLWLTAIALPLAGRRFRPLTCFAVQLLLLGLISRPVTAPPPVMLTVAVGGYFAVGVSGRWPRILTAAGAIGVNTLIHFTTGSGTSGLVLVSVWLLAATLRGLWQRSQTAEQYARALEREHRAEQLLAVQTERARIARELHDTLGHHVSVMLIQAGAARLALDGPSPAKSALQEVETVGREAMGELRQLLSLLGPEPDRGYEHEYDDDAEGPEDLQPQPGLTALDPLLDRIRAAGLPVRLITRGETRRLDGGVDLAAYRVVQEGLTNALKYAGGAPTEVTVEYEPAGVTVTVQDQGGPGTPGTPTIAGRDSSGRGLLGLRERVALYHGRFEAGRQPDGGYRIRAHFPDASRAGIPDTFSDEFPEAL